MFPTVRQIIMKDVNYISHLLQDNVDDIKALTLSFDKINIIEQVNASLAVAPDAKPNKEGKILAKSFNLPPPTANQ